MVLKPITMYLIVKIWIGDFRDNKAFGGNTKGLVRFLVTGDFALPYKANNVRLVG